MEQDHGKEFSGLAQSDPTHHDPRVIPIMGGDFNGKPGVYVYVISFSFAEGVG